MDFYAFANLWFSEVVFFTFITKIHEDIEIIG